MWRRITVLIGLTLTIAAAPAWARSGNGLYEPFPSAVTASAATAFYTQLGVRVSPTQLQRGVFARGLHPTTENGPSRRAGLDPGPAGIVPLALVAALGLAGAALVARRRSPSPTR